MSNVLILAIMAGVLFCAALLAGFVATIAAQILPILAILGGN